MTFKQFKTEIRKLIGYVGVGEFVNDPVDFNSQKSWERLYANPKFKKSYADPERMKFYQEILETIKKHKVLDNAKTLLDVGCGMGHFLQIVSQSFPQMETCGTDFSIEGLQVAKELVPNATFEQDDILCSNSEYVGKFDVVCCFEVLEHLLMPEMALQNIVNYCKLDGCVVVGVPNGRLDTYEGHIQFWSPESWDTFLKKNLQDLSVQTLQIENDRTNLALISQYKTSKTLHPKHLP